MDLSSVGLRDNFSQALVTLFKAESLTNQNKSKNMTYDNLDIKSIVTDIRSRTPVDLLIIFPSFEHHPVFVVLAK